MSHITKTLRTGEWIHIENPDAKDITFLHTQFPFIHSVNLEDIQESVIRSKLDTYHDHIFVSLAVPIDYTPGTRLEYLELTIIFNKDIIITVTNSKKNTSRLFEDIYKPQENPAISAYELSRRLYAKSSNVIAHMGKAVADIDSDILNTRSTTVIRKISILQRNLIYFATTLDAALPIFEKLENTTHSFLQEQISDYWGDIIDTLYEQRDLLDDYYNILKELSNSHQIILDYHTNHVIHILTIISVIFLPLNLIAGIYGMNFDFLPGTHYPYGFTFTILSMVLITVITFIVIKYKKWL